MKALVIGSLGLLGFVYFSNGFSSMKPPKTGSEPVLLNYTTIVPPSKKGKEWGYSIRVSTKADGSGGVWDCVEGNQSFQFTATASQIAGLIQIKQLVPGTNYITIYEAFDIYGPKGVCVTDPCTLSFDIVSLGDGTYTMIPFWRVFYLSSTATQCRLEPGKTKSPFLRNR